MHMIIPVGHGHTWWRLNHGVIVLPVARLQTPSSSHSICQYIDFSPCPLLPIGLPRLRAAGLHAGLDWCRLVWHHRPVWRASPKRELWWTHRQRTDHVLIQLQEDIYTLGEQLPPPTTYRGNGCSSFAAVQMTQEGENTIPHISDKSYFDRWALTYFAVGPDV